jgi:aminopeptidase N
MMQVAFGVDTWTKGLRNYLITKQYDAATSTDLYNGLQQAVNQDYPTNPPNVATIMSTWENQAGYPVITVSRSGNQLTLTQERFFYTEQTSSSLWWVPINYVVKSNPDFTNTRPDLWMPGQKTVMIESNAQKPWTASDWVIVNIQESSYYRVNYDNNLWNLLIAQLKGDDFSQIHLLNRAQLVDDSLNLARAGKIKYNVPFEILEYLSKENDYIPWAAVSWSI